MKVLSQKEKLDAAGATVLFVVHDRPELVREGLLAGLDVPYPVLLDPGREAYTAWGLTRARAAQIWLDPNVWATYLRLLRQGERLRRPGIDTLQLGGDFIVDARGVVRYARPQHRDDRPPVSELVRRLRELGEWSLSLGLHNPDGSNLP